MVNCPLANRYEYIQPFFIHISIETLSVSHDKADLGEKIFFLIWQYMNIYEVLLGN